jgi:hypothetical protein
MIIGIFFCSFSVILLATMVTNHRNPQTYPGWWLSPTPLKNDGLRQLDDYPIYGKTKTLWNHQPDIHTFGMCKKNYGEIYPRTLELYFQVPQHVFTWAHFYGDNEDRSDHDVMSSPIPHLVQVSEWTASKICWMKGNWVRSTWFGARVVLFSSPKPISSNSSGTLTTSMKLYTT